MDSCWRNSIYWTRANEFVKEFLQECMCTTERRSVVAGLVLEGEIITCIQSNSIQS